MINITDLHEEQKITPLWRQAFRPFFLFGCLFAILAIAAWAAVLAGKFYFSPYGGVTFWHGHEMIFGFVIAIIIGFLLTAVQSWTGLRATHGTALIGLFIVWLLGRILILFNPSNISIYVALIDLSFLLLSCLFLATIVLKAKQFRNLIFVPVLLLLAFANGLTHLSVITSEHYYYTWGIYAAVMLITLLMTVIAGRVFPMFTANGTGTQKVDNLPWLEKLVIGSTLILAIIYISNLADVLPEAFLSLVFWFSSMVHIVRALRWRPQVTLNTPLVWSLHLAYWFIPISLGLFALHFFPSIAGVNIAASTALHGLTAGAMSCLILAMIARISLGHTGRPLQPHWLVKYAFGLVLTAGISRLVADLIASHLTLNLYLVSALLWVLGYTIYLIVYLRILTSPRPDGRPG